MLVEKYIPQGTQGYQSLSRLFSNFDKLFSFSPLRWFGVWAILIAGDNVVSHLSDRWMYWSWNSLSIYLIIALIIFPYLDYLLNSKYEDLKQVNSVSAAGKIFLYGFSLFIIGANPLSLSLEVLYFGFPYILFFLVGHMTWGISINNGNSNKLLKKEIIPNLYLIILGSLTASILGYINDDPMISTAAAVFLPFPLVALFFPIAIRHLQRCRIYVVFIPTMFLSMRYPWLLGLLCPLFILSRHYYYFTIGKPHPTFKVDHSDEQLV